RRKPDIRDDAKLFRPTVGDASRHLSSNRYQEIWGILADFDPIFRVTPGGQLHRAPSHKRQIRNRLSHGDRARVFGFKAYPILIPRTEECSHVHLFPVPTDEPQDPLEEGPPP